MDTIHQEKDIAGGGEEHRNMKEGFTYNMARFVGWLNSIMTREGLEVRFSWKYLRYRVAK